jgi:hypothetical protein
MSIPAEKIGKLLASTFSEYVFSCVWDYRMIFFQPAFVQAQNRVLSDFAVKALKGCFRQQVETNGWPGSTQFRFQNDQGAILIWVSEKQADWFIAAPDSVSLETILRSVWELDRVGDSLYETSRIGKAVLEKIKQ